MREYLPYGWDTYKQRVGMRNQYCDNYDTKDLCGKDLCPLQLAMLNHYSEHDWNLDSFNYNFYKLTKNLFVKYKFVNKKHNQNMYNIFTNELHPEYEYYPTTLKSMDV